MSNRTGAFFIVLLLGGCGGGGGGDQPAPGPTPNPQQNPPPGASVDVRGTVQKGPFLVGSTVLINRLDNMGRSTSSTIVSQVEDSIGSFDFVSNEPGPVQIVASGYYFSELTGQPSGGTLTLRALYQLTNQPNQTAHVNMLTHLINDRALQLISASGRGFNDAIAQAESELLVAFQRALPVTGVATFSGLNLYNTSTTSTTAGAPVGSAYLLALSTAFYEYAATKAAEFGTTTDAELTLILNTLSADLAADGDIDRPGFVDEFIRAVRSLSPAVIADNLRSRSLVDYPHGLGVPDISVFLNLCAGDAECPWRAGAPMPLKVAEAASAVLNGKVYLFGGVFPRKPGEPIGPLDHLVDVYQYDVASNEWSKKAPMPFGFGFSGSPAHTIGDRIFVPVLWGQQLGAYVPDGPRNELVEYTPATDQWRTRAPRPTYRWRSASSVVNGKLYVLGGAGFIDDGPREPNKPSSLKSHVEIYDPASDSWTTGQAAPMPFSANNESCVHGDSIYIFGPETDAGLSGLVLKYDTAANTWSATAPMREPYRRGASCTAVDGAFYIVGGRGSVAEMDVVERYDPLHQSWTSPTRLPTRRAYGLAAVLGPEIVFVGGYGRPPGSSGGSVLLDLVEIVDTEIL